MEPKLTPRRVEKRDIQSRVADRWPLSIIEQAKIDIHVANLKKRTSPAAKFSPISFLKVFNEDLLEFLFEIEPGVFVPVLFKNNATHQLIASAWNDSNKNLPSWYATSVYAMSLKMVDEVPPIEIKRRLPKNCPAYKDSMSLDSKRGVLKFMIRACKAKVQIGTLMLRSGNECDELYRDICRANAIKRRRQKAKIG